MRGFNMKSLTTDFAMLQFIKTKVVIKNLKDEVLFVSPYEDVAAHNPKVYESRKRIESKDQFKFLNVYRGFSDKICISFSIEKSPEDLFSCEIGEGLILEVVVDDGEFVGSEKQLKWLADEPTETIRHYMPNAVAIVDRSWRPDKKYPWRRTGRRTFLWVVPLEERDSDAGRRVTSLPRLFASRKEALEWLYK